MAVTLTQPESWEQKEIQIKLERAEEFAKMPPAEQTRVLAEEKIKFETEQQKLRDELGYKPFKPGGEKAKQDDQAETRQKQAELAAFEASLGDKGKSKSPVPSEKNKETPTLEMKRFIELFNAAAENIVGKKPFEFSSLSINDFGQESKHLARMVKLTDHSQKAELDSGEIYQRLNNKLTTPGQIGLQIEIDMGEDKNNNLGLTNLSMEVSLASLLDGHFSEKMTRFTNLAFFAAQLHKKTQATQKPTPTRDKANKNEAKLNQSASNQGRKFGVSKVGEDAALAVVSPAIAIGPNAPAVFAFNQGSVWGHLEGQGAPANPKELQEALDKISKET